MERWREPPDLLLWPAPDASQQPAVTVTPTYSDIHWCQQFSFGLSWMCQQFSFCEIVLILMSTVFILCEMLTLPSDVVLLVSTVKFYKCC